MKKNVLLIVLIVILIFGILFVVHTMGNGREPKDLLIGTWKGLTDGESREYQVETTFTFEKDGKLTYSNEYGFTSKGKYEITENLITLKTETWDKERVYEFEIKDNKLTMKTKDIYLPNYTDMEKQEG